MDAGEHEIVAGFGGLTRGQGEQAAAVETGGRLEAGGFEGGGHDVEGGDEGVAALALGDTGGPMDDERHANAAEEEAAFMTFMGTVAGRRGGEGDGAPLSPAKTKRVLFHSSGPMAWRKFWMAASTALMWPK